MIIGTMIAIYTSYGEGEREALAMVQRMLLHGPNQATANSDFFDDNQECHELSELAMQVAKYAEVIRFRKLHMFKRNQESRCITLN